MPQPVAHQLRPYFRRAAIPGWLVTAAGVVLWIISVATKIDFLVEKAPSGLRWMLEWVTSPYSGLVVFALGIGVLVKVGRGYVTALADTQDGRITMSPPSARNLESPARRALPTECYPLLAKDIAHAERQRVNGGKYVFHVFSVGEKSANLNPGLMREVRDGLVAKIRASGISFDRIVAIERTSLHWASLVGVELDKPVAIVRERPTDLKGEVKRHQDSLLYERDLYFRGFKAGEKVIILDDVVSSGSTARTIIQALDQIRVGTMAVFTIIAKGEDYERFQSDTRVPLHFLHHVGLS